MSFLVAIIKANLLIIKYFKKNESACLELKKVDTMRDQSKRVNGRKKSKA